MLIYMIPRAYESYLKLMLKNVTYIDSPWLTCPNSEKTFFKRPSLTESGSPVDCLNPINGFNFGTINPKIHRYRNRIQKKRKNKIRHTLHENRRDRSRGRRCFSNSIVGISSGNAADGPERRTGFASRLRK